MSPQGSVFFSLQSKLIYTSVALVLAALALASSVFVFVRRGDQEQQELDHVIATSPTIFVGFSVLEERRASKELLAEFVGVVSEEFDVRVLIMDRRNAIIVADSAEGLVDETLSLPDEVTIRQPGHFTPYVSWKPPDGSAADGLVLVAPAASRFERFPPGQAERYRLLLAVPESTLSDAWRGLVAPLALAALIALTGAVVLAIVVARYITRPLQQLTVASQRMAEGTFDVEVSVDRRDEVGRLASAFSAMAVRVGEAHEQMRALVTNVSHDLKTPLTSILGFSQALRDGDDTGAESRRLGGVIHEEAMRLTSRLNDLLYLSELQSGQALLQRAEIDLQRLLESVVRRALAGRARAAGAEVSVETDLTAGLTVSADGPKLERALENLVDNARKYAPDGATVHIRTFADGTDGCIEVTNPAPGLSADELPRLFERFYRSDQTRRSSEGSGLGLPIARDLIELHGGSLTAELRAGDIVFTVRLPQRAV